MDPVVAQTPGGRIEVNWEPKASATAQAWEYAVLVTDCPYPLQSVAQLYRARARDQSLESSAGLHRGPHPAQENSYPPAPKPNLRASTAGFRFRTKYNRFTLLPVRCENNFILRVSA